MVALIAAPSRAGDAPPGATAPRAAPTDSPVGPRSSATRRSPGIALGLSFGVTAAGVGIIIASTQTDVGTALGTAGALTFLLGPTTGHWYAGSVANRGLGLRVATGSAAAVSGGVVLLCALGESGDGGICIVAVGVAVLSAVGYAGATLYEIADAPRAARRHNARHGLDVQVAPTLVSGDGNRAPGLAIAGRF
jgi:hypothetical protein